jgi:UDP-glucose 4-epimerase
VSGDNQFAREIHVFEQFINALSRSDDLDKGVFALISSAGGVHAGSPNPPFDAQTPPAPISSYGRAKYTQEEFARDTLGTLVPLLICRVSNAYGPGQDLKKLQGLVSRLALCTYKKEPLHLFVPTSTVRDYVFTSDIALQVHTWIDYITGTEPDPRTVVIASGEGTSIARLVKIAGDVSHRRIPIAMGSHPSARNQPLDSRFLPTLVPGLGLSPLTPLPVGVKAVFDDVIERLATTST